jgi:hypothetical protein
MENKENDFCTEQILDELDEYLHQQWKDMVIFVSENEDVVNITCTMFFSIGMLATFGIIF